ncbi:MAG: DUF5916 domain-containing protein [Ignavibacteriaceae bacterium]
MKQKLLLLLILISVGVYAKNDNPGKKLILRKTNADIKIDGVIDSVWSTADSATDYFQLSPYYDKKPTWPTVAKVLATDDALYCLIICYEDKKYIEPFTGMLDNATGEGVSIMLDTFDDNKTAYKFAVSVSGVRSDAILLDDARNRDYNWDGIWFAATKIYNWGWVAEIKIPYKSIQYNKDLSYWGLDFDRWIPSKSEDLYWNKYEKNEGQRVSKFGELVFQDFKPTVKGLNLEIYPVALAKATYEGNNKYKIDPNAGLDIMFNPSSALKFLLSVNPDFAQIEADPYKFNISRYETYYNERRPFFTEGSEVFMAAGKERNTGFYSPLQLFYFRRIGKKLPDGSEVPLILGTKAFGRIGSWEYGGFIAATDQKTYLDDTTLKTEQRAIFGSARIKEQFGENSSIGTLIVAKQTKDTTYGVVDIDGAFRQSDWQLSYQVARSVKNSLGDYAASIGFVSLGNKWWILGRNKYIGNNFNINEVGYVPWIGTTEITWLTGPIWYFNEGWISQILLLGGFSTNYKHIEDYTDRSAVLDFNMQFRDNWGYEITLISGAAKDQGIKYYSNEIDFNGWFKMNPKWNAHFYGGYSKTYNFNRNYLAFYSWLGANFQWNVGNILQFGTSYNMWVEGNPAGGVEDITYDTRPYFSLTPVNDLNVRVYVDNLYDSSSDHLEQLISGLLFSYNFSPKSWIYFAYNELDNRNQQFDMFGNPLPQRMHVAAREGVFKIKYLYYF